MAVVTGVLLDHVDQHPAQRDVAAPLVPPALVERFERRLDRARVLAFLSPVGERFGHVGRVDVVEVAIDVRVVVETGWRVLPSDLPHHAPEPGALDIAHVPDEPEQRHGGRLDRPQSQPVVGEALALHGQRGSVVVEVSPQHRAFVTLQDRMDAFDGHGAAFSP